MNDELNEAIANALTSVDTMISKISEIRESYNAAQTGGDTKSLILSLEKDNKPKLKKMYDTLEEQINTIKTIGAAE